nr:coat protein [Tanacetum cinerariifolium]
MDNDILNIDCETDIDEIIQDWSNRLSAQIQLTEELRVLHPRNLLNFIIHKTSGNVYRFIESLDELEQSRITTDAMTTFNNVVARIVQEFTGRIPGVEASNEAFREHAYWRLINLKISSTQKSTQASNSNTQQPSSPSPGRLEFMKREEDIEKFSVVNNKKKEKEKEKDEEEEEEEKEKEKEEKEKEKEKGEEEENPGRVILDLADVMRLK